MANLTPWALVKLLGDDAPSSLRQRVKNLKPISSAFMAYLGVDEAAIEDEIDHHQVIVDPNEAVGRGEFGVRVDLAQVGSPCATGSTGDHDLNAYARCRVVCAG